MNNAFMLYEPDGNLLNSLMALKQGHINDDLPKAEHGDITFDDLLVAVGKTRNRDAFVRVFEYFAPRVKSFLMKGGLDQDMADELAQETMVSVWQKAAGYDPQKAAASTWIFTIARNKRIDYFRKAGRPEPDINDPMMAADIILPDEQTSRAEQGRFLADAIGELPAEQANLIKKSFFEEKTHADIAKETGIPLGTVKSRIRLALDKMRYHMGQDNKEDIMGETSSESH